MYSTELIHPFHKKMRDRNGKANLDVYITVPCVHIVLANKYFTPNYNVKESCLSNLHILFFAVSNLAYAPEIRSVGFTIDGPDGRILFKCLPSESSATRLLVFQTLDGVHVLHVKTETPYCCSWFKVIKIKQHIFLLR